MARDELAAQAGVDPRDPEPTAAGRALAGLAEVALESRVRYIREGLKGEELRAAVASDIDRASRLLETGLWSFSLMALGARAKRQARDVTEAAELTRAQVVAAMEQARTAFREVRRQGQAAMKQVRADVRAQRGGKRHGPGALRVPSIAVLGPGGVGGFVAAALARARANVALVAREPAATALTLTGVSVRSAVLGTFVAHPGVVAELTEPVDVAARRHQGRRTAGGA